MLRRYRSLTTTAQRRLERKAAQAARRAERWNAMSVEPNQPQSPLEQRMAGSRKPLKPLYDAVHC